MSEERDKPDDLGWANGDPALFPKYHACIDAGHDTGDENLDLTMHGYDRLFYCNTCRYEFHVDSSG
jgi:hypothetical protein